ncbi:uncharacterized protein LOC125752372 [Canis lupus dingo]|uniref:uncharacterized protein LOC125752372 n=1 Tax=Canis lupus dingo TaxID=286419 RepID=UPI0020C2E039|nr:uncharacterized protein LOC125752372 [Canis lupus dingo]
MATAGGAKMEPASCAKQSRSRNALRCLRFVPRWKRHSAERGGAAGRRGGGRAGGLGRRGCSLPGGGPRWVRPGGAASSPESRLTDLPRAKVLPAVPRSSRPRSETGGGRSPGRSLGGRLCSAALGRAAGSADAAGSPGPEKPASLAVLEEIQGEAETQAEAEEAGSLREPYAELDPRTPGSCFEPKGEDFKNMSPTNLEQISIRTGSLPAIALLGIYPKDTDAMKRRDTCTPMFLAAMATIAKLWKEPRCPWKDEWIKKMWSMYAMEYSSAIRNDKYPPFASTWMELEGIMLSEVKNVMEECDEGRNPKLSLHLE